MLRTNHTLLSRILFGFSLLAGLFLVACPTSNESEHALSIQIDEDNDSLLSFDIVAINVFSKDSSISQLVFKGKITDPKQVQGLTLDPKMGQQYTVSIIGYRGDSIAMNKVVTVLGPNDFQSKDVVVHIDRPETTVIEPNMPEIKALSDTLVREGDTLIFLVHVDNPFKGEAKFLLEGAPLSAALDTANQQSGEVRFYWVTNLQQGRPAPYTMTIVYASSDRMVRWPIQITVQNVNRPPKLTPMDNHSAKENETLTFKIEASDPDGDTLLFTASNLPSGAQFKGGTFFWKPETGQAGNYFPKFLVTDGVATDSLETVLVIGNVLPPPGRPVVKGKTPTNSRLPVWTWSSGGGGTGTFRYRLNSDDLSTAKPTQDTSYVPPTTLSEDIHTLFVQEMNADGVWSLSGRLSIAVDTTPPNAPLVSVPTLTNNSKPTWTWIPGAGKGAGVYRYKLDTADFKTGSASTTSMNFTPANDLTEATHILYVQEQDSAGNWSAFGSASVTLDLTPPGAPKVSLAQTTPTNLSKPAWNWVSGGNGGMGLFRSKLDDSVLTVGTTPSNVKNFAPDSPLQEGTHILNVQERDSAGNWSRSGSMALYVDLTPPGAPVFDTTPLSPLNSLKPKWTWKSGGNGGMGGYRYKLDDSILTSGATDLGMAQFSPLTNLSEEPHTLYVQERDSAGNWSSTSSKTLVLALRGEMGDALPERSGFTSLAQSNSGVLYIAFRDGSFGYKTTVMRLNVDETHWEYVGSAGFSAGEASSISLALSSAGVPYIAFTDGGNGNKATVMRLNAAESGWETVGMAGFSAGAAYSTSLALSKTGVPFVAFTDVEKANKATVMRLNAAGSGWEPLGTAGFSAGEVSFTSLVLNGVGIPYVAFTDGGNGNKATVMRLNAAGSAWEAVGMAGFSAGPATYTSLALSTTGIPYVAFRDESSGRRATVMRLNAAGSLWEIVGTAGFSAGSVSSTSLALDKMGTPYLAFADGANGDKTTVMRLDGAATAWEIMGKPGLASGEASSISLILNNTGVPLVAFVDDGNRQKPTVMQVSFDP